MKQKLLQDGFIRKGSTTASSSIKTTYQKQSLTVDLYNSISTENDNRNEYWVDITYPKFEFSLSDDKIRVPKGYVLDKN